MSIKTLSIRMKENDYRFLSFLAEEEEEDISKTVRELLELGRVMLAIDKYKKREASLEKASRLAGVSISKMMDILQEFGVRTNIEYEDYLNSIKNLKNVW